MSESPLSSCSSSLSPSIVLDESRSKLHPGYLVEKSVCKYCQSQYWVQKNIVFNIGIGLFAWGKVPQKTSVIIGTNKYCSHCNADYNNSAKIKKIWSCCGDEHTSYGCSTKDSGDMKFGCIDCD